MAGPTVSNNVDIMYISVRNGLAEGDGIITDRVYTDDLGANSVETLFQFGAPARVYSADPLHQEIAEYNVKDKASTTILRVPRYFVDPITAVFKPEDEHSLANNAVPEQGYLGKQVATFETDDWNKPDEVFYNPGIGDPGYVGVFPDKWLYLNPITSTYCVWIPWRHENFYDHHLIISEGSLHVIMYGAAIEASVPNTIHRWLGLFRYNGTGTYTVGSWSKVHIFGPINVDSIDNGNTRRVLVASERTSKGVTDFTAHPSYIQIINPYLNDGQGVVSYAGGPWENCSSNEGGGDIDFTKYVDLSGSKPWRTQKTYVGSDSDDTWWWQFWPTSLDYPLNSWVRNAVLVGSPAGGGGGHTLALIAGDYQVSKWTQFPGSSWWDTGSGTPIPIDAPNMIQMFVGATDPGQTIFLRVFESWNGIWHEPVGFEIEGTVNDGSKVVYHLSDEELNKDPDGKAMYFIMATSELFDGGIHNDVVYRGRITFLSWGPPYPSTKGIYTGTFDPLTANVGFSDQPLVFKRNDFWDGQNLAQKVFQVSRTDGRLYLARPYNVPGGGHMVGRYETPFENTVFSIGGGGYLDDEEAITDNITKTQGILGLDLTDAV